MGARRITVAAVVLASASLAGAQGGKPPLQSGDVRPTGALTKDMGIDQKLNAQVPKEARFLDEDGKSIAFGDLLGKRPLILLPMFYQCKGVCRLEVDELFKTIKKEPSDVGKAFDVVFLGLHPKETPALAKARERLIVDAYRREGAEAGFHMLTGPMSSIRAVTDAVGFRFMYDEPTDRINHPAGIIFLTPDGRVSSYIYGKDYPSSIVRTNLAAATSGAIGAKPEIVLLGCVMIDPVTGKRTLVIENVIKLAGIATVLILIGSIVHMSRKYKAPLGPTGGVQP